MSKLLGIDYGKRRVGLAVSDDLGRLAFPNVVLENDSSILEKIQKIIKDENIDTIVVGESKNFKGEPNEIMKDIEEFVGILKKENSARVFLEPEFMTSQQAERIVGKNDMNDAGAASLILQSFIDKRANSL